MFHFQCKTHYNAVIQEVNTTLLFRNYPVFSSFKWRCLSLCSLFMGMSLPWLVSFLLSATNGRTLQNSMYGGTNLFIVAPLLFLVFICGLPVIYGCRKIVRLFLCVLLEELCFIIFLWDVPFYDFFITLYSFLKIWTHWYYNTTCDITSEANVWCISISLPYLNQLYPLSCFNHRELHGLKIVYIYEMQKYTKDSINFRKKTFYRSFEQKKIFILYKHVRRIQYIGYVRLNETSHSFTFACVEATFFHFRDEKNE